MAKRRQTKLAIALICADWRLHRGPVDLNRRLARALGVDGAAVLGIPGPDGLLRPERHTEWQVALAQIEMLMPSHNPVALAIVAHQRCIAHPVSDAAHDNDVVKTARALKRMTGFKGPVEAFVAQHLTDRKWELKRLARF